MLRFTLRQLEYFVVTAECASVARAAERLNVSQPSISVAVGKLEDQFGVQLFIRHHAQGMSLTAVGRRLLADARDLLRHGKQIQQDAESLGQSVQGELELGCFATFAPLYLPGLISSFCDLHPDVQIRLHEGEQDELIAGLLSGRFEFALMYDWEVPAEIEKVPLLSFQPYVLLPADHRLAKRKRIPLASLEHEPYILLDVTPSRSFFLAVFRSLGLEPRVAFASPSIEMVRGMVGRKRGYSLLVTHPPFDHTYDGTPIVTRPLAETTLPGELCIARLKRVRPTRLMLGFAEHCGIWFARQRKNAAEASAGARNSD